MGPRHRSGMLASAVALLALSACGGGDDAADDAKAKADEKAAVASISQYWQATGIAAEKADCLGEGYVEKFGVPHLQDLGILDQLEATTKVATEPSSATDAPVAATVIVDCLTPAGIMQQGYQLTDPEQAACIASAYGRQRLIDAKSDQLQGKTPEAPPAEVTDQMKACVDKKK